MIDGENCLQLCTYQGQNKNCIIRKWKHKCHSKLKFLKKLFKPFSKYRLFLFLTEKSWDNNSLIH